MSTIKKRLDKFYRKPIPNDITFEEIETLCAYFGCTIISGGKHSKKVVHKESGTIIPIPMHGKCIGEAYIKELKDLFDSIKEDRK